jgi:hypothetical protein
LGSGQLGRKEVFDAEIHDILEGLRCAVLAKQGANLPVPEHLPSVSYRRRQVKSQIAVDYQQWWQGVGRAGYSSLGLASSYGSSLNSLSCAVFWDIYSLPDHTTVTLRTTTKDFTQARRPWNAPVGAKSRLPSLLLQEGPSPSSGSAGTRSRSGDRMIPP